MSKLPAETSSAASSKSVTDLLSEDYSYYLFEQLMATEKDFNLEHFEFVEVILSWIKANRPSHAKITKLWELIRQKDLSYHYLYRVRTRLNCVHKELQHTSGCEAGGQCLQIL